MDYSKMTQDQEHSFLVAILNQQSFDFTNHATTYMILREEFNNDVLSLFENEFSELAYANDKDKADYSKLNDNLFDKLLKQIVEPLSTDVLLGIGDNYSIVKEQFNNEILDAYAKEHFTKLFNNFVYTIDDSPLMNTAPSITEDDVTIKWQDDVSGDKEHIFDFDELVDAELTSGEYYAKDDSGEECKICFYELKSVF